MKIPILRTILHIFVQSLIVYALLTSNGCTRHTDVIILKQPNTLGYDVALAEAMGER